MRRATSEAISRGREWVEGLQSKNGGWGAFDADNIYYYLNNIPFADHGALLDPPTDDVTGRCIGLLMQLGATADDPHVKAGVDFLRNSQLKDGSWFGRWGVNYNLRHLVGAGGTERRGPSAQRANDQTRRRLARPPFRMRMAAGAKAATATSSTTPAMNARPPARHRPRGR